MRRWLRNLFTTVGCLTVLAVTGFLVFEYRSQIGCVYRTLTGNEGEAEPVPAVGVPADRALESAHRKEALLTTENGPEHVVLTADEIVSLIVERLHPAAKDALDSIRVVLSEDRLQLEGQILIDVFTRDLLGPLVELLGERHPIRAAGPARLQRVGVVAWTCDEFVIQSFPFPPSAIPRLVNRLTGGTEGAFLIPVPEAVGDVRIRPDGVTLYRRVN